MYVGGTFGVGSDKVETEGTAVSYTHLDVSKRQSLTQPLFNKGANIAQLKIAKAQQEEAKLSFQQSLLNAGSEVNEALVKYQTCLLYTSPKKDWSWKDNRLEIS